MDILALLLVMSDHPGPSPFEGEARDLIWYGKPAFQDPHLGKPSNRGNRSSLGPRDPRYEVKVLRKTLESQILEPFDRSEGQVVALVGGQALNCGIGPRKGFLNKQRVTYLSAKDVLRWSKVAEWLDGYEQRNPGHGVAIPPSEDLTHTNVLYFNLDAAGANIPENSLSVHASDFPGGSLLALDKYFWTGALGFVVKTKVLLILLVALPLIYGGIHLTTWNFHFASQTEHLLWKIACIDIMGTIPLGVTFFACTSRISDIVLSKQRSRGKRFAVRQASRYINWVLFTPMSIFYALSRIYIVVESFISLRHVPIGVYAAIPWVQDIPHI